MGGRLKSLPSPQINLNPLLFQVGRYLGLTSWPSPWWVFSQRCPDRHWLERAVARTTETNHWRKCHYFWGCGKWGIHLMTIPWLSGLFSSYFLESSFLESPLLWNVLRSGKEVRISQQYPQCELWKSISFGKIHPHFAPGFVLVFDDCVSWGFPTWAARGPGPSLLPHWRQRRLYFLRDSFCPMVVDKGSQETVLVWPWVSLFSSLSISVVTEAFNNFYSWGKVEDKLPKHPEYPFVTDIIIFIILLFAQNLFFMT